MVFQSPLFVTFDEKRSEEHTSELQSRLHLVCRLLLEKKKNDRDHPDVRHRDHGRDALLHPRPQHECSEHVPTCRAQHRAAPTHSPVALHCASSPGARGRPSTRGVTHPYACSEQRYARIVARPPFQSARRHATPEMSSPRIVLRTTSSQTTTSLFFFLNNRAPPKISPFPLPDALPT